MPCSFSSALALVCGPIQSRPLISLSIATWICCVMCSVLALSSGPKFSLTNSWPSASPIWLSTSTTQRCHLGHAAQRAAVEVEVLVDEGPGQERRRDMRHVPAQVGLDVVELAHAQLE